MKAYFTVEAACILPVMLSVYVFLIYGMFYQYDRCLLEQDVALMVLREQWTMEQNSKEEEKQTRGLDQYVAFKLEDNVLRKEKGEVRAWAQGIVTMPQGTLMALPGDENWQLEASFTSTEIKPAQWIRLSRKFMEEIESVTDRICEEP